MDIEDGILESFNYDNIYISSIFLFQIETMANWSEKIILLLSSRLAGTVVLWILTITTFISLTIKGLIIAVYCNNMKRMHDADVFTRINRTSRESSSISSTASVSHWETSSSTHSQAQM